MPLRREIVPVSLLVLLYNPFIDSVLSFKQLLLSLDFVIKRIPSSIFLPENYHVCIIT